MIRKLLVSLLAALALPAASGAATLSVLSDKLNYQIGETVTLTVIGDDQGALAYSLFGRLVYPSALLDPISSSQNPVGSSSGWVLGSLNNLDGSAEAFNQVTLNPPPANNLPGAFSVVQLLATAPGIVNVSWTPI